MRGFSLALLFAFVALASVGHAADERICDRMEPVASSPPLWGVPPTSSLRTLQPATKFEAQAEIRCWVRGDINAERNVLTIAEVGERRAFRYWIEYTSGTAGVAKIAGAPTNEGHNWRIWCTRHRGTCWAQLDGDEITVNVERRTAGRVSVDFRLPDGRRPEMIAHLASGPRIEIPPAGGLSAGTPPVSRLEVRDAEAIASSLRDGSAVRFSWQDGTEERDAFITVPSFLAVSELLVWASDALTTPE